MIQSLHIFCVGDRKQLILSFRLGVLMVRSGFFLKLRLVAPCCAGGSGMVKARMGPAVRPGPEDCPHLAPLPGCGCVPRWVGRPGSQRRAQAALCPPELQTWFHAVRRSLPWGIPMVSAPDTLSLTSLRSPVISISNVCVVYPHMTNHDLLFCWQAFSLLLNLAVCVTRYATATLMLWWASFQQTSHRSHPTPASG